MESLTLKLIDRQKRIRNKIIAYFGLLPSGLFSIGCFYIPRHSQTRLTLFERVFDFESYWRIIGPFGLLAVGMTYIFLGKLLPFKNGTLLLTKEKIRINSGKINNDFQIDSLKGLEFKTDIPFDTDDRPDFQKASLLKFRIGKRKFVFEVCTDTKAELEALTPIIKAWKELNPEFKYGYK